MQKEGQGRERTEGVQHLSTLEKGARYGCCFKRVFRDKKNERPSLVLVAQVKKGGFRLEFWVEET